MSSPFLHPTAVALGVLIFAMLGGSILQFIFLRGLAKRHATQWRHAGEPTIWTDQSLVSAWPTIQYLRRRDYRASGDPTGIAFCDLFRFPLLVGYWATVVAFVAVLVLLFTAGWPMEWT